MDICIDRMGHTKLDIDPKEIAIATTETIKKIKLNAKFNSQYAFMHEPSLEERVHCRKIFLKELDHHLSQYLLEFPSEIIPLYNISINTTIHGRVLYFEAYTRIYKINDCYVEDFDNELTIREVKSC